MSETRLERAMRKLQADVDLAARVPQPTSALEDVGIVLDALRAAERVIRDVLDGRVAKVWYDAVENEHVVIFHGPWVVQAQSLLKDTPDPHDDDA